MKKKPSCAIFQTVGEARKTQCFELLKHAAKVKLEEKYAYIKKNALYLHVQKCGDTLNYPKDSII